MAHSRRYFVTRIGPLYPNDLIRPTDETKAVLLENLKTSDNSLNGKFLREEQYKFKNPDPKKCLPYRFIHYELYGAEQMRHLDQELESQAEPGNLKNRICVIKCNSKKIDAMEVNNIIAIYPYYRHFSKSLEKDLFEKYWNKAIIDSTPIGKFFLKSTSKKEEKSTDGPTNEAAKSISIKSFDTTY